MRKILIISIVVGCCIVVAAIATAIVIWIFRHQHHSSTTLSPLVTSTSTVTSSHFTSTVPPVHSTTIDPKKWNTLGSLLASNMDLTVNPCEDFYSYACGGYIHTHPIPQNDSKARVSFVNDIQNEILTRLKNAMETPNVGSTEQINDDFRAKTGEIYEKCKLRKESVDVANEAILGLFDFLGGWPVLNNGSVSIDLPTFFGKIQSVFPEVTPLIALSVAPDLYYSTVSTIYLTQGRLILANSSDYDEMLHPDINNNYRRTYQAVATVLGADAGIDVEAPSFQIATADAVNDMWDFETELARAGTYDHQRFQTFNDAFSGKEVNFSTSLHSATRDQLELMYPIFAPDFDTTWNWKTFLEGYLPEEAASFIDDPDSRYIILGASNYLASLPEIIDWFDEVTLVNYGFGVLISHLLRLGFINSDQFDVKFGSMEGLPHSLREGSGSSSTVNDFVNKNMQIRDDFLANGENYQSSTEAPDNYCAAYLSEGLPLAAAAIFEAAYPNIAGIESVSGARVIVDHAKSILSQGLRTFKGPLDPETRANLITKIDYLDVNFNFADPSLENITFLNAYYSSMDISSGYNWVETYFAVSRFKIQKRSLTLVENKKSRQFTTNRANFEFDIPPLSVLPSYNCVKNTVSVPLGLMLPPLFHYDNPAAVNYGYLGQQILTQMGLAVSQVGVQFNAQGNFDTSFLQGISVSTFDDMATCLKQRSSNNCVNISSELNVPHFDNSTNYKFTAGNFVPSYVTVCENGSNTLNAVFGCDVGSNYGYDAYSKSNSTTKRQIVPHLVDFSMDQIYFIAGAVPYCGVQGSVLRQNQLIYGYTPLPSCGVNENLIDNPYFAEVFKCEKGSQMNPNSGNGKCRIWN